ncbi:MAG: SPOR domain-containing protein [Candidatus Eisenbacteria bacterium]
MRTRRIGIVVASAALLLTVLGGCTGLTRRGESDRHREAEQIDTFVREPAEDSGLVLVPPPAEEGAPKPALSPVPEETAPVLAPPPAAPESADLEIAPAAEETGPGPERAAPDSPAEIPPPTAEPKHVSGFRVQLYASREPDRAKEFAESARSSFEEPIYVEFLEPYYKVRVGDCLTREGARELLARAKAAGFDQAWVASTLVLQRTKSVR